MNDGYESRPGATRRDDANADARKRAVQHLTWPQGQDLQRDDNQK